MSARRDGATLFFFKHAGWSYDPKTETSPQGRWRCARELADAEAYADARGWHAEWEWDEEPYQPGDAETEMPREVLGCVLRSASGEHLASLWGIGDPSRESTAAWSKPSLRSKRERKSKPRCSRQFDGGRQ